ncbi:DUF2851 family protein [Mucilaginibacter sp. CSA2-8R]|uniref:DUF2851 family protein n=1 Tax=Mucilaginibacter sp. CSA2-8R TaxID=3141542 RepID=UPI00315DACD3
MVFNEDFLHYVWKFKLFDFKDLTTTDGQKLDVISVGMHNLNAGPDFSNSRIRIGDTTWAGNTEIHLAASDWEKHKHTTDNAYDNVVLHVVYRNDQSIAAPDGRTLPTLELRDRIPADLYLRYHQLLLVNERRIIPCQATLKTVNAINLHSWLTRVLVERLDKRTSAVIDALKNNQGDWETTFYQFLAANFGFSVNALPFELLAKSLPQNILAKHKNNALQIEALIFGQAGFLNEEYLDEYPQRLKNEYSFLRKKYQLSPIEKHLWKFMRLRPQNFPTIRLAQFAALVIQSQHLFSKILEFKDVRDVKELFSNIDVNTYWETHYRFDQESKLLSKTFGKASVNLLLINTVALMLFAYGRHYKQEQYVDKSLLLLESLPFERNHVVDDFEEMGVKIKNAFESQALLELKNNYCNHKKCLQCGIGNHILNLK